MDRNETVGSVVARRPSLSRIFEIHGIDYCCGGNRTLAEAAQGAGVALDTLLEQIGAAPQESDDRDWTQATVAELIAHILAAHHDWLKREMPRLSALAEKVARVHGGSHPDLERVRDVYELLRADMEPHLMKEERILFPAALALEETGVPSLPCHGTGPFSLQGPMAQMEVEHEGVGGMLDELRALTGLFAPPDEACNTWRALYAALEELDSNTRAHVHLENQVLHHRLRELESQAA